ncbi:hypothetical protein ABTY59_11215 [Streptomyces sp. NPDC096079]|uniref:hypothetical protein n=1 Tax=Streptomyces sp. NPDC096079 TaxID=3155820 RepID=UPI00333368AD
MSYAEHQSVFSAPAVPLGTAAKVGETIGHGTYTEGVTRRLSAAAFVRADWWAVLRAILAQHWKALKAAVRKRLRWIFPEKPQEVAEQEEPAPPAVVLGEDYAVWVRRRIKKPARPVPVYGFHQEPVVHACDRAVRHMRGRRTAIVVLVAAVAWQTGVGTLGAGWAALVLLAGSWGVHLVDRYLAQLRLNALLAGELQAPEAADQAYALPYQYECRPTGDRHRFIGAGLQAWHEAVIGIDVEPAPENQDAEHDAAAEPFPSPGSPTVRSGSPDMAAVAKAVLDALTKHNEPVAKKPLKHFTAAQLHAYIARRLDDPAPSHHQSHPKLRVEVVGISGIHQKRWSQIDDDTWRSLHALAVDETGDKPAEEVARRYIWARVTAWNGELVAAVLVHFAYQGGFLRVTVRPHIMGPLNPRVAGLVPAVPLTPTWLARAAFNALVDVYVGLDRLLRRKTRPRPELDPGSGPVSLREVYSTRRLDDMHAYDDARYYVQMMQRRVFDSTEIFLRDHNVDIAAYRQQSTAIYNFGVMNGGTMTGPVQAAPLSANPSMSN